MSDNDSDIVKDFLAESYENLDRLDRDRIRARSAAGRVGRGLSELAMDLCLVGRSDGDRFRVDVLAIPNSPARPTCPGCRARPRTVAGRS